MTSTAQSQGGCSSDRLHGVILISLIVIVTLMIMNIHLYTFGNDSSVAIAPRQAVTEVRVIGAKLRETLPLNKVVERLPEKPKEEIKVKAISTVGGLPVFGSKCPPGKRGTEVPILHTDKPHIHIGIFTRNRFPYIQATAEALGYSLERHPEFKPYVHVNVYDDASSELSIDALIKKYPSLERIIHFQTSKGWRGAGIARVFHEDCVASSHDICVFGDSDMILHPDWMVQLVGNMNNTDGQLTLYNSCCHDIIDCYDRLCQKKSFGAAAAAMTRELAAEYICNVPPIGPLNDAFDWKWGEYLNDTNRRVFSVNPSMAEHIGISHATNGIASQNEQSWNFNIFDLPQPLATVMYHHLDSRLSSACNKSKIDIPNGWKPSFNRDSEKFMNQQFFIQQP